MKLAFWRRRTDRVIDTLIKAPRYSFVGLDDDLRKRTEARRQRAEQLLDRASEIVTGEDKLIIVAARARYSGRG